MGLLIGAIIKTWLTMGIFLGLLNAITYYASNSTIFTLEEYRENADELAQRSKFSLIVYKVIGLPIMFIADLVFKGIDKIAGKM